MWRKSWQFDKIKCKSWNVKISLQIFEFYVKENGTLLQATRENTHPDLTWPSVVVFSVVVCNLHQNLPRNLCLWRTLCWRVQSYSPSQIDWVFHQPLVSVLCLSNSWISYPLDPRTLSVLDFQIRETRFKQSSVQANSWSASRATKFVTTSWPVFLIATGHQ